MPHWPENSTAELQGRYVNTGRAFALLDCKSRLKVPERCVLLEATLFGGFRKQGELGKLKGALLNQTFFGMCMAA